MLWAATGLARDLTLEQALVLAEQHSFQLKESRALYEASDRSVAAVQAERWPNLSLEGRASYIDDIPTLDLELPGGFSMSRTLGSNETYQADFLLSLPLYTGGRLSSGIASARSTRDYAEAVAEATTDRVHLQTRQYYLGLQRAVEMDRAARASLRRTEILRNDVKASFAAGAADSVDLLEVDLAQTRAEFEAQQAQVAVQTQTIQLLTHLGLSLQESVKLSDSLPDPQLLPPLSTVTGQRPELRAAGAAVSAARARLRSAQSGWLPTLAAFSGYSYGKPNNDLFADRWTDYFTVGARLQWSLNLGRRTARQSQAARFELEAARHRLNDLDESIGRDLEVAGENLRLAGLHYASARRQFELTESNYRLAQAQHRAGALSSNRLLEIEAALTAAEAALVAAKVDFYLAQSAYYYVAGDERLGKGI
jgi:outer membrane protein TolC